MTKVKTYIAVCEYQNMNYTHGKLQRDTRQYDFLTDIPLQENDKVVVQSVNGLAIVTVVGIKRESPRASAWVIQKVDLAEHKARIEREEKRKELIQEMNARAKEVTRIQQFQMMAKDDPAMQKLLEQFQSLEAEEQTLITIDEVK